MEDKLKKEYGDNDNAVYGTMNKMGYMAGNKETAKGEEAQDKHDMRRKKKKGSWVRKAAEAESA
jgi:hypothetical protein